MSFLMLDSPNPYTAQGTFPRRGVRGKLTGTAILHTSEGNWQAGVDSLTRLVRTRTDHGCYHVAVDWLDTAWYYPWEWETWQDSETNNWAVGIAAACRTSDWAVMPVDVREGYIRNMAAAAADFVKYMKAQYGITVPLKRISGAQARAGVPGFCAHGDSGIARSDPGADFPWGTFFEYTKQALGGVTPKGSTTGGLTMADINTITAQLADIQAKLGPINTSSGEVDLRQFIAWGTRAAQKAEEQTGPINTSSGPVDLRQFVAWGTRAAQEAVARSAALEEVIKALVAANASGGAPIALEALTEAAEKGAAKALSNLKGTITIEQEEV